VIGITGKKHKNEEACYVWALIVFVFIHAVCAGSTGFVIGAIDMKVKLPHVTTTNQEEARNVVKLVATPTVLP